MKLKIKIDTNGFLQVMRGGQYKPQYCPRHVIDTRQQAYSNCGDWCPMFGEPETDSGNTITLCGGGISGMIVEVIDERGQA